ncbi:unnamed protein product [Phyllotreta striolata]|uniref:PHD finger protein 10 n=1 Tax=Phyllotreta striolata TaxID=444603 RepID=A0A9N9THV0_PHYSR|nr:unnamed protein product [Phyllotreta striolata]
MNSVKTDEELTSTMGNVLSTSKEEKNDSSDATPTSSTDANTNLKAAQTVSEDPVDPISSTSSDIFDQSKPPDAKSSIDESDRLQADEHENDLLGIPVSNEKITADVEDLVHDLESLLGETSEPYKLPYQSRSNSKAHTSSAVPEVVDKEDVVKDEIEPPKNAVDKKAEKQPTDDIQETPEPTPEPTPECTSPSIDNAIDKSEAEIPSVDNNFEQPSTSKVEEFVSADQSVPEQVSPPEKSDVRDDVDGGSMESWEIVDADTVNSIPGPSGDSIPIQECKVTAEDITSSGDKPETSDNREESEDNREAESTQLEVINAPEQDELVADAADVEKHSNENEATEAVPVQTDELAEEVATSSQLESEVDNSIKEPLNVASPTEITSSETCVTAGTEELDNKEELIEPMQSNDVENIEESTSTNDEKPLIPSETEQVANPTPIEDSSHVEEQQTLVRETEVAKENVEEVLEHSEVSKLDEHREEAGKLESEPEVQQIPTEIEAASTSVEEIESHSAQIEPESTEISASVNKNDDNNCVKEPETVTLELPLEKCDEKVDTLTKSKDDDDESVETVSEKLPEVVQNEENKSAQEPSISETSTQMESEIVEPKLGETSKQLAEPKLGETSKQLVEPKLGETSKQLVETKLGETSKQIVETKLLNQNLEVSDLNSIITEDNDIKVAEIEDVPIADTTKKSEEVETQIKNDKVVLNDFAKEQPQDPTESLADERQTEKHISHLQFAPLQLSEEDSDDSEVVPRLALEPDDSNSPAIPDTNELPSEEILPQVEMENKPMYIETAVRPVIDTTDNIETMLAVASLQNIDIPKQDESQHVVSEKERREMEALARAVQSITDNSSSYVEYIEPNVPQVSVEAIQEEPTVQIMDTMEVLCSAKNAEITTSQAVPDEGAGLQLDVSKEDQVEVTERIEPSVQSAGEIVLPEEKVVQESIQQTVAPEEVVAEKVLNEVAASNNENVDAKEIETVRNLPVEESKPLEVVPKEIEENLIEGVSKKHNTEERHKVCETFEEKSKEHAHNSENSQDSVNSISEVSTKESRKGRSTDKPKKHKRVDKYEELSINVDVPEREAVYSPKITIKPIKVPDEEVSTTTYGDSEASKGSLKMTITKQSDNTHSILKISDQDYSDCLPEPEEPIPKLIIKPKMQQVESQHSPKMSTRSSKQSPTGSSQRSSSPRITIKPVIKPDKQEPVSPIKIKINTKANAKQCGDDDEGSRKSVKPIKLNDDIEQVQSPRITIKPIPKPDSEKEIVNPRLTIKPIKKLEEDAENEERERSSPKIIIKPLIKPQELDSPHGDEEEEVKERIVLKINKGHLPSPAKESKKREHPVDDEKSEKLVKITVKFPKEGGHPHIVQQPGDDNSPKRSHDENSGSEKNKKQKVESDSVISTRSSSRHKEQQEASSDKSTAGAEVKLKHKDHSHESPVETKRARKDNLSDKTKLLKDENFEELLFIDAKLTSPVTISEDSRSQDNSSIIVLDDSKDGSDRVRSSEGIQKPLLPELNCSTSIPPMVKRGRGRPRGRPRKTPLEVRVEPILDETQKPKESAMVLDQQPQVHDSGRPKRSCRGQSVCDTLGIKPRKPRGPGRGRGGKRGMGNRAVVERDPLAINPADLKREDFPKAVEIDRKDEVIIIEEEIKQKGAGKSIARKSCEKDPKADVASAVIEIDSGDSVHSEGDRNANASLEKRNDGGVECMEIDDNDAEVEVITKTPKRHLLTVSSRKSHQQEADKKADKPPVVIIRKVKDVDAKRLAADEVVPVPFASLAPPSTSRDFSALETSTKPDISSVSSTTIPAEIMIVDEETRMSAETNSRAQTPAKQVIASSEMVEESQSSVHSTTTTESGKTQSRPSKTPRLEVQETESQIITADLLTEYYWNGNGPFMLQEQVAQFLGIKSFKRKYPGIMRRMLDIHERDFIREKGLASEHMCDLGLTAVNSADILDIMYSDFQDKYEDYCKHQRDRQAKDMFNKQKALSLATSQEKNKADITEQAVQSAAQWNARFNKERREQRKACMDLQNFTVHYPKGKKSPHAINTNPGIYPVALVPGQFAEFYKEFSPTELNNLPINTMCYDEIRFIPRDDSEESGSESESDSSTSSGSSTCSSSDSDSSSGIDDCKLCKHPTKKAAISSQPVSPAATATK